jgi:polyphosphate kinase 2 (PPK2 family)
VRAYENALSRCSTPWAPWYVVPANHKWYRNLVVSQVIVETLETLGMQYPPPLPDADQITIP